MTADDVTHTSYVTSSRRVINHETSSRTRFGPFRFRPFPGQTCARYRSSLEMTETGGVRTSDESVGGLKSAWVKNAITELNDTF